LGFITNFVDGTMDRLTANTTATPKQWNKHIYVKHNLDGVFDLVGIDGTSMVKIVAYCFAPVAGYSSFGSYTGNGSADGPFVYTGFRPGGFVKSDL
jgi:hypothetical protein